MHIRIAHHTISVRCSKYELAALTNRYVISMTDKWEYPWYAAWALVYHMASFVEIDPYFAKEQLLLVLRESYMHPNGQIPAYEWNFSDVNPPVHSWAVWNVYEKDKNQTGKGDTDFLEKAFQKLMINFTWWVNQKEKHGTDLFDGGFLGLDNIGVFDRNHLPEGKNEHFFYEFFDGDTGKGHGASHQTGWTALIANLIMDMEADKTDKKMDDRQIENVLAESR